MQTYKYDNFTDCVRHTYQTEKYRGFFRGVTAPMASVTLVRTISFSVYQRSKYAYAAWLRQNFGVDPLVHVNTPGTYPTFSTLACFGAAGATAGSFITLVACECGGTHYYSNQLTYSRSIRIDKTQCSGICSHGGSKQLECIRSCKWQSCCSKLPKQRNI